MRDITASQRLSAGIGHRLLLLSVGFVLETREEVDSVYAKMIADGIDADANADAGSLGILCRCSGGFIIEVASLEGTHGRLERVKEAARPGIDRFVLIPVSRRRDDVTQKDVHQEARRLSPAASSFTML